MLIGKRLLIGYSHIRFIFLQTHSTLKTGISYLPRMAVAGGGEMVSGMVNMRAQWKDKEGIEREKMLKFSNRIYR